MHFVLVTPETGLDVACLAALAWLRCTLCVVIRSGITQVYQGRAGMGAGQGTLQKMRELYWGKEGGLARVRGPWWKW